MVRMVHFMYGLGLIVAVQIGGVASALGQETSAFDRFGDEPAESLVQQLEPVSIFHLELADADARLVYQCRCVQIEASGPLGKTGKHIQLSQRSCGLTHFFEAGLHTVDPHKPALQRAAILNLSVIVSWMPLLVILVNILKTSIYS